MTHVFPSKDTPLQRSFPGQRPNTALNRATGTARNGAKPPVEGQGGRTAQEGSPGWRAAASRPHHASWAGTRGHHLSRAYRTHRAANPPRNRNQGFLETRANTAQPPPAHSLLLTPLPSGDMLHRRNVSPAPGPRDKLRRLEERLSSQERTTAFLLHQAFRLKDDIVSYLQESTGYQHRETAARQLLENHVQTIAGMVQKLCQDIEVLERQIRTRDGATAQTNFAVQSLDHKHIQSLGDLRGRVARLTSILSDFKDQMQHQQKWTEAQLTRSEDQAQHRHQLLNAMKERLEAAEKKIDEKLLLLSLKLEQTEKPEEYKQELNQMRSDENNLHARITRFERQIWKELEEIQNEYRSGFQSIHESLELLKQIQNAKLKLEKKKMKKDTQRYKASDLP
ncbi:protein FAM81B isoform X3 [Anas platyrhynchos]|uniref:protein FAM81B isoform X3 n=1 Tax=Anas platyrhynchos TaxID=8839 RepID=UPI003AF28AB4